MYRVMIMSLLAISLMGMPAFASPQSDYDDGYNDGLNGKKPVKPTNDNYMKGWDDALWGKERRSLDSDPDEKGGGKDPLVFGKWQYDENDNAKCLSQYRFDYDNDSFGENFCYIIKGDVFVVDFGGGIVSGYNMLNFDNTIYAGMTPTEYLYKFPDTCEKNKCYLWNDHDGNLVASDDELESFSFEIWHVQNYPFGELLLENGRYVYCEGTTRNGETFHCVKPSYWQRGT